MKHWGISIAILLFSLLGLGFWINYAIDAQQRHNEAIDDYWEACEDVAQVYAEIIVSAEEKVAKWQDIYDKYLQDFGSNSAITLDASDKLMRAKEDLLHTLIWVDNNIEQTYIGGFLGDEDAEWLKVRVRQIREGE